MVLTLDHDTQTLAAHLAGIRTRIATLLSQAENGRILVTNAQELQAKKQEELTQYRLLLTEIEIWLETTRHTIENFVIPSDEFQVENSITGFEKLNKELEEKEEKLKQLATACEAFRKYPDLEELVVTLLEQLELLTIIFTEQKTVITIKIENLKVHLCELKEQKLKPVQTPDLSLEATLDSASMPIEEIPIHADTKTSTQDFIHTEIVQGVHIETQTGRSLSSPPPQEPVAKDFTVTYNEPVDAQIQTQMSHPSSEAEPTQKKEKITISKRTSGGQETIKIATKPMTEPQPIVEEPDDLLVEGYYRKRPESETRFTELNITNAQTNQPFETIFVEPDETTTEVIVDADGTKRIIVKKLHRTVVRQQQSSQQQQFTTLSTLTEGDGPPISESFSQITLKGQQSSTSVARGDGRKETLTTQQYGGKVVSGVPGGDIDIKEYQTEPETHYSVVGATVKPTEVEVQGIKLHQGDVTFVDSENNKLVPIDQAQQLTLEGDQIHTSSSSVRAVVQQVTRRIIRKTRRIVRRIVIIDGKEHVTEEVIEEPEEVEITEEGIPRVSINVTRTENGKVVQEQQFGETATFEKPDVTVTEKTTTVVLDADGNPMQNLPENITVTTQPDLRYVVDQSSPPQHEFAPLVAEKDKRSSAISEFIEHESLAASPPDSSKVEKAPSVDVAPKRKKDKKKKTPKDESDSDLISNESISVTAVKVPHLTESTKVVTKVAELTKLLDTSKTHDEEKIAKTSTTVDITKPESETEVKVTSTPDIIQETNIKVSQTPPADDTSAKTYTIEERPQPLESPVEEKIQKASKPKPKTQTILTQTSFESPKKSTPKQTKPEIAAHTIVTQTSFDSTKEDISEPDQFKPSAPLEEELLEPVKQNGVDISTIRSLTQNFISSEQLHEPGEQLHELGELNKDTEEPAESPKTKKKRKFSKSKKVSGTPRSQSPLVSPEDEETIQPVTPKLETVELKKTEIQPESKETIEAKFTSPELELVPKTVQPETVTLQKTEILPETTDMLRTKFTQITLEPVAKEEEPKDKKTPEQKLTTIVLEKTTVLTPGISTAEFTTTKLEPTPQVKDKSSTEIIKVEEINKITTCTTEPSKNVEIVLSLEEKQPEITLVKQEGTKTTAEESILVPAEIKREVTVVEQDKPKKEVVLEENQSEITVSKQDITQEKSEEKQSEITVVEQDLIKDQNIPLEKDNTENIDQEPFELIKKPKTPSIVDFIENERNNAERVLSLEEKQPAKSKYPEETSQTVKFDLSLQEKPIDSSIATPKLSVALEIKESKDKSIPSEILHKNIDVQLPTATIEKTPIVEKLESEHEEPSTPSDIDHGGRRSKKKKKHKDSSNTPTPSEEKIEIESVVTSLAESTEISIAEDSVKSEDSPKPTMEDFGTLSESDEEYNKKGKDTGYEADKTTVDESVADDDEHAQKKIRRKKRKQKVKVKESDESHVPDSVHDSTPGESVPLTDDEPAKVKPAVQETKKSKKRKKGKRKQSESEPEIEFQVTPAVESDGKPEEPTILEAGSKEIVSPTDSLHTLSTPSEPGTVKIIEEKVPSRPQSESPKDIVTEIIRTVPVIEAVITQETVSQTSPVSDVTTEFIEEEKVATEAVSMQTSPEVPTETTDTSMQTQEEPKTEAEVSVKPEIQETSTQIEIQQAEIVTQTTPKAQSPEQIPKETTETSIQTASPVKIEISEEAVQTISPEPVEIPRAESAMQTTIVESQEEFVQTKSPEQIPTAEIATQVQPASTELSMQTSPEPSAPTIEAEPEPIVQEILKEPIKTVETTEHVTQTSPVVIQEVVEVPYPTPTPTPTPSFSEQYEVLVQATVIVPSDSESVTDTQTPVPTQSDKSDEKVRVQQEIEPETKSNTIESSTTQQSTKDGHSKTVKEQSPESLSDWETSSEEYEVQVMVDGVAVDQHHVVTSFMEAERDGEKPGKRKRRRRKHKSNRDQQRESVEKDLFSEFQRQASRKDSLDPKDLYSDVAKRGSRSSSPVRSGTEIEQVVSKLPTEAVKPEDEPIRSVIKIDHTVSKSKEPVQPENVLPITSFAETDKAVPSEPLDMVLQVKLDTTQEKQPFSEPSEPQKPDDDRQPLSEPSGPKKPDDRQAEVTSKVFTDINEEKVKELVDQKKDKQKPTPKKREEKKAKSKANKVSLDETDTTVNVSITIPQDSQASSLGYEITTQDVFTVTEDKDSKTPTTATFTIESILTETELKDKTPGSKTPLESEPEISRPSVTSTVEFITREKEPITITAAKSGDLGNVIVEETVLINDKPVKLEPEIGEASVGYKVTQPEDQKPKQVPKPKKGKHVSSVTIEEVQSPIVTDTPLTPTYDSPLSPPSYSAATWQQPSPKDISQAFIQGETHQGPVLFKEVNVRWNQAQALERCKNLQNAKKTTHLSNILYLATLNEIVTDETVEQRDNNVQQNLLVLQEAVEKRDVVVIQQTIITTVETITTWLETIEYRIYVNRQQTSEGPSKERVEEFNSLKGEIANIEQKVGQLQSVMQQADGIYNDDDRQRMKSYIDSLQQQVKVIEEVTEENELLAFGDLKRWDEFINGVSIVSQEVRTLKRQLSDLKDSDAAPQTKLNELEKLENNNRCQMLKAVNLIATAKGLMRDFPSREIPKEVYTNHELTKQLEQQITVEREKALQFLSLADEYEQTLKEFSQIIDIAEALVESPISVRNLEHLEDEMQNHRKFFVNLSHCRAILESLEENLDSETRAIHSKLHKNLYDRAKVILDKSTGRFQLMSLAASRWTVLEQGTKEEMRWLQVAQQRVPDLNSVTSSDYDRYIDLYQSLAADIDHHHSKLTHLNDVAQKLQELVYCSGLEQAYTESLEIIKTLQEDVRNNLEYLLAFGDSWTTYNLLSDKVEYWLRDAENQLKRIEVPSGPRGHMRQFWELKAKHEVHNVTRQNATSALEKSLQIVPISDEMLQRKFHSELQGQWQKVSKKINDMQTAIIETISAPDVPVNEKLALLEQELQDLKLDLDSLQGIIKTEEELNLYIERLQIMSTRLDTIQNELGKLGLLSVTESDKVGTLLALSKRLEITITEELEGGNLLKDRLHAIQKGLSRVRRKHSELGKTLDQCESTEKLGSDAVEKAVNDCYEVGEELVTLWQDLMCLRQLLHTLPMRLKVTVSPLKVERDISQLQDDHTALEKRCGQILALLRNRLALWQRFERQLELVQQSVSEADFMMELLTVQGTVDYERLRKATERLESVSVDLVSRENLVSELKDVAKPLADSCAPEVSARVEAAVNEAVTAYTTTCDNLKQLCTRYSHAADLWKQYKEATDLVKEWIENPMEEVEGLDAEESVGKVKVCEETLAAHTKRLADLQQLVSGIASAVGLDAKALLGGEVEALGKRLEDVRESLTALADVAEAKTKTKNQQVSEINGTRTYLDSVQKSLNDIESSDLDADTEEKLTSLRDHLIALSKTEGQIQKIQDQTIELSTTRTETTVIEILELWQQVFRETFQQYHRLSTRLVRNEDGAAALRLWQEYLLNVQQFLQGTIPGDYHSLSEHQHLCQVHQNLLATQQNVLKPVDKSGTQLASGLVESSVMEQFNSLTNMHNETLSRIMDRHSEVESRLSAWDKYKEDQNKLLAWLKNIEKEREHMQLRYMHIRRIPKLSSRIQSLIDKLPQGIEQVEDLQRQQNVLLQFCDDALATSIRMEHVAIKQRISNLQAGLETWKQFLERISQLVITHENRVNQLQKLFDGVQQVVNESQSQVLSSHASISNRLEILQRTRERLNYANKGLEELGLTQEQLKECLSPSDIKTVNQRMWLLWHQHGDLDHQLATLCHQLEEKLGIRSMFEARQSRFVAWADEIEKRLDLETEQTQITTDPKELLRKLEIELQAEMALKEREYNWLIRVGKELVESCGEEYADVTAKQIIQTRTNVVYERWERLENLGRSRANKIHDMMQTMLQLEERIQQIRAWLSQIELQLSKPLVFEACTKDVIDRKLQEHDKLRKSIENESGNIGEVLNLCELLLSDAGVWKSHFSTENIIPAIKNVEKRWKIVCGQSAERKRKITFIWKLLQEVLKLSTDQDQWLTEREQKLKELDKPSKKLNREEIQQLIYLVENEIKDIESRSPAFQILEQTYSKLATASSIEPDNMQELTSRARIIIARWENLLPKAQSVLQRLQNELVPFKEFSLAHEDAVVGLSKIDAQLTELQHLAPPEKVSPKERLSRLEEIEKQLSSQTPNLESADNLGLQIMKKSTKREVTKIQEMIDEYQILCKDINERITLLKTEITTEIKRLPREVDESVQVETLKFEQDTAVQVNTLPPQLQRMTSISAKDAYLVELEAALVECKANLTELETFVNKEIPKPGSSELPTSGKKIAKSSAKCQASIELVTHLHDLLVNECDATKEEASSEEVHILIERFQTLLVRAKDKEQKLRELRATVSDAYNLLCQHEAGRLLCPLCTKRNWAQLDNDLWRLEKWLQVAEGTQKTQRNPPSNIEQLEDIIQDNHEFLLDLDSHKSIVRSLNIVGTHLADHTEDTSRAEELRTRLEADNKRWDSICRYAANWQMQLQRALMDNQQFHGIISELCVWLEKNERKIRASEPVDLTASTETIEAKYQNFLELRAELERCEPRVLSLQEAANQLLREDDAPEGSSHICRRLTELRLKLQSLIRLTVVYTLKLGAVLGRDPNEIGLAMSASPSTGSPLQALSYDLLDRTSQDQPSTSAPDDSAYNGTASDEESQINTSVLRRGYCFLGRVVRASVPIQALMLLMLGAASLVPYDENDYSCSLVNTIANSLTPTLRYNDGPPPI